MLTTTHDHATQATRGHAGELVAAAIAQEACEGVTCGAANTPFGVVGELRRQLGPTVLLVFVVYGSEIFRYSTSRPVGGGFINFRSPGGSRLESFCQKTSGGACEQLAGGRYAQTGLKVWASR